MDAREKLVELLSQIQSYGVKQGSHITHQEGKTNREIASHLIAHGVTVQEWIPVTERLPGFDTERVLVMTQGDLILGYPKMDTDRYVNGNWVRYGDHVTHWMPLPEPPKMYEADNNVGRKKEG